MTLDVNPIYMGLTYISSWYLAQGIKRLIVDEMCLGNLYEYILDLGLLNGIHRNLTTL